MKILTLNTWQERGPWRDRWEMIFQEIELLKPDLIAFQEVFNPKWADEIKKRTGFYSMVISAEPSGLMFLSRFPVKGWATLAMKSQSPTEDYLRYALFAEIEMQESRLAVFNTHLSWMLDEGSVRERQVEELLDFIDQKSKGHETAVMGDFNATSSTREIRKMIAANFTDTFAALYPNLPGLTWSNENPYACDSSHPLPDRRIDYIFTRNASKELEDLESVKVVMSAPRLLRSVQPRAKMRGAKPDGGGVWPSDHFGLLATFS